MELPWHTMLKPMVKVRLAVPSKTAKAQTMLTRQAI